MKNATLVVLFLVTTTFLMAQQAYYPVGMKDRFDVNKEIPNTSLKSTSLRESRLAAQNNMWQYTLMDGGFFTIGLNNGITNSVLEKNSQITYGHPFAMTSFAYAVIDGEKIAPEYLLGNDAEALKRNRDSLIYSVELQSDLHATLLVHLKNNTQIAITYRVENNGSSAHEVGAGILLDAALGKWGDGAAFTNGVVSNLPTDSWNVQDSIVVYERASAPKGIGISLKTEKSNPDKIQTGNWQNLYENKFSTLDLYDLALLYSWNAKSLQPSEVLEFELCVNLLAPDYTSGEFLRWNLPNALSIEKNMLFPMEIPTQMEVVSDADLNGLTYQIIGQPFVTEYTAKDGITMKGNVNKTNQSVNVNFLENYDAVIAPITLNLLKNGQVIDQITRNVFIPAAPYSNEGLKVEIDSVYKTNEQIQLTFQVSDMATEQLLYKIFSNNTSFLINDLPIEDYTLERDKSGRVNEVDIVFILDVTGSMSNEISQVKNNMIEFTDSLTKNGVDYRLGMVTFLDDIENTYNFTDDNEEFKSFVGQQFAHGGGDYPENSLLGLNRGTEFQFRPKAKRIFIWITDATFHINNSYTSLTKEKVIESLLEKGIQTHCIGNPREQLEYYDQITLNTGGNFYDINGNFRDILLDISRLGESPKFKISFTPPANSSDEDIFKIEVHYAGLGGCDTIQYGDIGLAKAFYKQKKVGVNPMPINRNSTLTIFEKGTYNVTYQVMNLMGQVLQNGMFARVQGQNPVDLSEVIQLSEKSNQTLLLKVDVYDEANNPIQSQVIKIIR